MRAFWYNQNRKNLTGLKIRELRQKKNLSIRDLASQIQVHGYTDITENTITKIELGIRFVADYEICIFAEVLDTNPNYLLDFE